LSSVTNFSITAPSGHVSAPRTTVIDVQPQQSIMLPIPVGSSELESTEDHTITNRLSKKPNIRT
jgi:hypothetical protein